MLVLILVLDWPLWAVALELQSSSRCVSSQKLPLLSERQADLALLLPPRPCKRPSHPLSLIFVLCSYF